MKVTRSTWEALDGVSVDGVGGSYLISLVAFFPLLLRFASFFSLSPYTRAKDCNYWKPWHISL